MSLASPVNSQHLAALLSADRSSAPVNKIGSRVKAAREARGMSQGELEKAAHLSKGYVSRLEHGTRGKRISGAIAQRLAAALHVPRGWVEDETVPDALDLDGITIRPAAPRATVEDDYPSRGVVLAMLEARGDVPPDVIAGLRAERCSAGDPGESYWWDRVRELTKRSKAASRFLGDDVFDEKPEE